MQYLKEMPNGQRVSVPETQWVSDKFRYGIQRRGKKRGVVVIVQTDSLIIYRLNGARPPMPVKGKWGGRPSAAEAYAM